MIKNLCLLCNTNNKIIRKWESSYDDGQWPGYKKWRTESYESEICTNCINLCDKCNDKVLAKTKGDFLYELCLNCNPSTSEKVYEYDNGWKLKFVKCTTCQNVTVPSGHRNRFCQNCNPSRYVEDNKIINGNTFNGYVMKYSYNDKEGWIFNGYEYNCIRCVIGKWKTYNNSDASNLGICRDCDPSNKLIKYSWNGNNGWTIKGYFIICDSCTSPFLHARPTCDVNMCKNCNPSTKTEEYKYDVFSGWELVSSVRKCKSCYNEYWHPLFSNTFRCVRCDPSDSHNKFKRSTKNGEGEIPGIMGIYGRDIYGMDKEKGWKLDKIWYFDGKRHGWKSPEKYGISLKYFCTNEKCIKAMHKPLTLNIITS